MQVRNFPKLLDWASKAAFVNANKKKLNDDMSQFANTSSDVRYILPNFRN